MPASHPSWLPEATSAQVPGTLVEANDDWDLSNNKQALIDSGLAPTNPVESAIIRALPPGNYTAIVKGAQGTTGIAVVEAYGIN
jgi:hypothetical protein